MSSERRDPSDKIIYDVANLEGNLPYEEESAEFYEHIGSFRAVIERTSDCLMLLRYASLEIIDVNVSTCKNLNYKRHELLQSYAYEYLPHDVLDVISGSSDNGLYVCEPRAGLITNLRRKDGSMLPVEITASGIRFGGDEYVVLVARDISERMAMEGTVRDSEHKCWSTMNAIRDAVVVCNSDISVVSSNMAFTELCEKTGMPLPKAGLPLSVCAPYLTGELGLEYRYIFSTGKVLVTTVHHETLFGELIFEVTKTPISENDVVVRVVTVVRDITEQQHLENMKKEAFEQIEHNMEQFAILNDHIRNPLQTIVGLADLEGGKGSDLIVSAAMEIDYMVKELDCGWLESGKIRDMLFRHYGIRPWTRRRLGLCGKKDGN